MTIMILAIMTSCNFSKSVKKDFVSGVLTKGDGLSCENVYLSLNDQETKQTTFVYGQKFRMEFDNIAGFKKENGNVYPGMQVIVLNNAGDTVLLANDLYSEKTDGLNLSPLLLSATVTAASPINSGGEYILYVNIWDKKEKGTFTGQMNFKVVPNDLFTVEANKVTFDEIYLISLERGIVIPDNKIKFNENIYLILEGVTGFKEETGMVFPGLSLKASDDANNVILDNDDLFADYNESGLSLLDLHSQVSTHFLLNAGELKNPMHCELVLWDKKSDARLTVKTDLIVE